MKLTTAMYKASIFVCIYLIRSNILETFDSLTFDYIVLNQTLLLQ